METKYPRLVTQQQRALAMVRIFGGGICLAALLSQLTPQFVPGFYRVLAPLVETTPFGFYKGFLVDVVVPHHMAFAYLVLLMELLVGAGLVLGLCTGPLALLGAFFALNYFFAAAGLGFATAAFGLTGVVVGVALALAHAGTTWGVDRQLVGRMPYWLHGLTHHEYREF